MHANFRSTPEAITARLTALLKAEDPRYELIITYDTDYTAME